MSSSNSGFASANSSGQNKKTSTSETGHDKNVANFENLISFCSGYGLTYNPSKAGLKILQLQAQLAACKANIIAVTNASVAYNNAVNARKLAFEGLQKLSTRLINAFDVSGASTEAVKDARSVNRKISGSRLTKADAGIAPDPTEENMPAPLTPKKISSSQKSYSSLIEHFAKLITILSAEPSYLPNENDLKIAALNTLLANLKNLNTAVINAYTNVSNARIIRDTALYNLTNGLCPVAKEVKMYVKSVFGSSGAQYKQVSGIVFKVVK